MRFMPGIYSFYKGVDGFLWFCLIALVLRIFMVCFVYFVSFFVNFFLLLLHFIGFSAAFCRSQPCVLQELALRFVGDSVAFCCTLHTQEVQNAERKLLFYVHFYAFLYDGFLCCECIYNDKKGQKHSKWHVQWCRAVTKKGAQRCVFYGFGVQFLLERWIGWDVLCKEKETI